MPNTLQNIQENAHLAQTESLSADANNKHRADTVAQNAISTAGLPVLAKDEYYLSRLERELARAKSSKNSASNSESNSNSKHSESLEKKHAQFEKLKTRSQQAVQARIDSIPADLPEKLNLDLPVSQRADDLIQAIIDNQVIIVAGETGSGKTTTLYASLLRLNDSTRNILTVEDPIEYYIDGIGQTQVNTKVDMSFARGLRAILRQDPDVVMVGEIRDIETAQIAIQASLTGHLVLSTLHTNSAVGAVTRLRDMGVEPFLLSSSLLGVLAQRLVRVLDPLTRESYMSDARELKIFGQTEPVELYRPNAAAAARRGGYKGRTGIYELVGIDETMRQLIHSSAAESELERHARQFSPSILSDGWLKAARGITSIDEVLKVTRED